MWDPKPNAPAEYRGEFGTMSTTVPGVQLTDMLPKCAAMMDKWSIIRSLTHGDAGHSAADQICFTGYPPGPNPDENIHPSCGSIVAKQLGPLSKDLPSYVMIPRLLPGADSAYLGPTCRPFETQADPAAEGPFNLPNFELTSGLSLNRLGDRHALVQSFDRLRQDADQSGMMTAMDGFQRQAVDILTSDRARAAFDLDAEPRELRERYGFMPAFRPPEPTRCGAPAWSQRMLLARRLVEAGVRLVTVDLRWWDTHVLGFESLRLGFLPRFDQAYSALIADLEERGLLESTLVRPHAARQRQRRAGPLSERLQRGAGGGADSRRTRPRRERFERSVSAGESRHAAGRAVYDVPAPRRRHGPALPGSGRPTDRRAPLRTAAHRTDVDRRRHWPRRTTEYTEERKEMHRRQQRQQRIIRRPGR
jgi:hypothetical protein